VDLTHKVVGTGRSTKATKSMNGGAMQQAAQFENTANFEQIARDIGHRWGERLKEEYLENDQTIGSWPGTLDEARRLIDTAIGHRVGDEQRELLALLVERGARRAWHTSDRRSGIMLK
jgi:hypothetical protein